MSLKMFMFPLFFAVCWAGLHPFFSSTSTWPWFRQWVPFPFFFPPWACARYIPITLPYARTARTQEKQCLKFIQWLSQGDINCANPLQQAKEGWHWQTHLKTIPLSCPHHQALAWFAPSICVPNMEFQQAEGVGVGKRVSKQFFVIKPLPDLRPIFGAFFLARDERRCAIYVAYFGRSVEGSREVWGICAIYVGIPSLILANDWDLRHLCPPSMSSKASLMLRKKIGCRPAQKMCKK